MSKLYVFLIIEFEINIENLINVLTFLFLIVRMEFSIYSSNFNLLLDYRFVKEFDEFFNLVGKDVYLIFLVSGMGWVVCKLIER